MVLKLFAILQHTFSDYDVFDTSLFCFSQRLALLNIMLSDNKILSPRPLYSPRRNKSSKLDYSFGSNPPVTVPVPLFNQNKSSSVHSVASLDESSSTTDSGFNSVAAAQPLVPSPNSAFSPRYPPLVMQNSLNNTMPRSPDTDAFARSSRASMSSDVTSVDQTTDGESSFVARAKTLDGDHVSVYSEPVVRRVPKSIETDSEAESIVYNRGRQRHRRNPNRFVETENKNPTDNRSLSKSRYVTQAELQRLSNRKSLFDQFVAQAEERDRQARIEQGIVSTNKADRTRSASLNRVSSDPNAPVDLTQSSLKRSSSINSRGKPFSTGLRRSSSVDIQDMISKAEKRDRHARVEQARLEGLLPPRRHTGHQDAVKVRSRQPASSIIKQFETKNETTSFSVARSPRDSDFVHGQLNAASSRGHRKFSSFMTNSRVAKPGGYHRVVRYNQQSAGEDPRYARNTASNGSDAPNCLNLPLNSNLQKENPRYSASSNGNQ